MRSIIFIATFLCLGCLEVQPSEQTLESPFMDIKAYFQTEMTKERLNARKTTSIAGEKETIQIEKLDLEQELKIFADADITKVAWFEKYDIKKIGGLTTYTCNDKKLKTREIKIYRTNDQIDSLFIHNSMTSMIMDTDQFLFYYPNGGYKINIEQVGKLQEGNSYQVEVSY